MAKRRFLGMLLLCLPFLRMQAQEVSRLFYRSVQAIPRTWVIDTLNVNKQPLDAFAFLAQPVTTPATQQQEEEQTLLRASEDGFISVPSGSLVGENSYLITLYGYVVADEYSKPSLVWNTSVPASVLLDGAEVARQENPSTAGADETVPLVLAPGAHLVQVNLVAQSVDTARVRLCFEGSLHPLALYPQSHAEKGKPYRPLDLSFMLQTPSVGALSLSPTGGYAVVGLHTLYGVRKGWRTLLMDSKGKISREEASPYVLWHPTEEAQIVVEENEHGNCLLLKFLDPMKPSKELAYNVPKGQMFLSPDGNYLFVQHEEQAPAKDALAIRFRDPDDRMPGWRNSSQISLVSLQTGVVQPLTHGSRTARIMDVHPTTPSLLLALDTVNWTTGTTYNFVSLVSYNYLTGKADTLLRNEVDIAEARYMPMAPGQLLVVGSPNTFGGVGKQLPAAQAANGYEHELFVLDIQNKKARCLTTDFDPSIDQLQPDHKGGFYVLAVDGARRTLYHLDKAARQLLPVEDIREPYIKYIGANSRGIWYVGKGANSADRLYLWERGKSKLILDLDAEKMSSGYIRPEYKPWRFSYNNTPIEAWYYLPPHFDSSKRYPMIVYYYGGTLPTQLGMEGAYSLPMYAAQGYVVLTLNPSGAIGYGQSFAARHLNAWGEPMAQEILQATRQFCQEHSFVNPEKIGCMGASYGGFMTQYLQTVDSLFAAAVSHAGISNIANYWGSGYWGLGYNAVAANGSYPWSRKDIFVERSPLFNAHKIKTPLLLLHGDSDTNVPTAESINMYNALKILGKEVEMVHFTGQDHFIADPERRVYWTYYIMAWFQRWLKDDPSWWNDITPE